MNKEQFASKLAREMKKRGVAIGVKEAEKFFLALSKSMSEGLARDKELTLSSFGTFVVLRYSAKIIQSPRKDKSKFFMPPTDVIKWRPSLKLRDRAPSAPVDEKEFAQLKNAADDEEIFADDLTDNQESSDRFAVGVRFLPRGSVAHFTDETSPISRLSRMILNEIDLLEIETFEIRPTNDFCELLYLSGEELIAKKSLPSLFHKSIVEKFKTLAKNQGVISNHNSQFKLEKTLTKFGESLILERIF